MQNLIKLAHRVYDLERRLSGLVRHGTVEEVDPKAGTARLRLGEGTDKPYLSPAVPYAQIGGSLKIHSPVSKGQQMTIIAPGGDFRQAVAVPMTFSDANKSPGDSADENVLTFGSVRVGLKGDALTVSVGGVTVTIDGSGLTIEGGKVTHNLKNIGDTHIHGGVERGGADTDVPSN